MKKRGFIVSCRSYEIRGGGNKIVTEEDTEFWLHFDNEGGGWYQWGHSEDKAYWFATMKKAHRIALDNDGMPYWCRIKPNTLKVYDLTKETITKETKKLAGEFA